MNDSQLAHLNDFFQRVKLTDGFMQSYYRMFYVFQQVLENNGVEFFAHSGTMLGVARHQAIIPWDDDIDVMVEDCFEEQLLTLVPELERYGITLQKKLCEHLYQFNCKNPLIAPDKVFLQIDVFIGQRETINDQPCLHFKTPEFKNWFPRRHIFLEDLYPLKEYDFGPLKIKGFRKYDRFFTQCRFDLNEAIVDRHLNFDHFKPEIEELKKSGLYPIRDKAILAYKHDIDPESIDKGLEFYLL